MKKQCFSFINTQILLGITVDMFKIDFMRRVDTEPLNIRHIIQPSMCTQVVDLFKHVVTISLCQHSRFLPS